MLTMMMVLMVEMGLMMIPMMLGVMAMTMAVIPPSGREIPRRFLPAGALLLSVSFPPRGGSGIILRAPF